MADQGLPGLSPRLSRTCNLCKERKVRCIGMQPKDPLFANGADVISRAWSIILRKLHSRLTSFSTYAASTYCTFDAHNIFRNEKFHAISLRHDGRSGSPSKSRLVHQLTQESRPANRVRNNSTINFMTFGVSETISFHISRACEIEAPVRTFHRPDLARPITCRRASSQRCSKYLQGES